MITEIQDQNDYTAAKKRPALIYFSHEACAVCKVLKPRVSELLTSLFPNLTMYYVDVRKLPEIAGQESVFTVPTILIFFDGRETHRRSRNIGIDELRGLIYRPYHLYFGSADQTPH